MRFNLKQFPRCARLFLKKFISKTSYALKQFPRCARGLFLKESIRKEELYIENVSALRALEGNIGPILTCLLDNYKPLCLLSDNNRK